MSRHNTSAWTAMQEMNKATVQNSQHPESVAKDCRKKLCQLVPTLLNSKQSKVEFSKNLKKLVECVLHCIEQFPQIFTITYKYSEDGNPYERARLRSMDFSKWLVQYFWNLIFRINNSKEERLCVQLIVKIFEVVYFTDPSFSRYLSEELVSFAKDLMIAKDNLTRNNVGDNKITICRFFYADERINVNNIQFHDSLILDKHDRLMISTADESDDEATSHLKPNKIVLLERVKCENLQVMTMMVMRGVLESLTLFGNGETENMWLVVCDNLENGRYPLRLASLEVGGQLAKLNGPPQNYHTEMYLVNCLVALTECMASPSVQLGSDVDSDAFQKVLAVALTEVLIPCVDQHSSDLNNLISKFTNILTRIKCEALQNSVGQVLTHIFSEDASRAVQWKQSITKLLGRLMNSQWLPRCLYIIIAKEVDIISNAHLERSPVQILHRLSQGSQDSYAVEQSNTWLRLIEKLKRYSDSCKTEDNLIFCLQSTCEILQVGVHLVSNDLRPKFSTIVPPAFQVWTSLFEEQTFHQILEPHKLFSMVIAYAKAMLNYQRLNKISDEISTTIFCLLILPWMNETNLLTKVPDHVAARLEMFREVTFTPQDKIAALPLLVALPCIIDNGLVISVLNSEMTSTNQAIQIAAIESIPVFLYISGINNLFYFDRTLRAQMANGSNDTIQVLANISGELVCVLCEGCEMNWCLPMENRYCYGLGLECSSNKALPHDAPVLALLDVLWQLLFCQSDPSIRLAATSNLKHIFRHLQKCTNLLNLSIAMLEDGSYDVRKAFSKIIQPYYEAFANTIGNFDDLIAHINKAFCTAQSNGNWRLKETIILTVGNLGEVADEELLLVMVVILLENLLSPIKLISVTSSRKIQSLAASKNLTTKEFFIRFRRWVAQLLVTVLHEAQERGDMNPLDTLTPMINVFNFDSRKAFIQSEYSITLFTCCDRQYVCKPIEVASLRSVLPDFLPILIIRNSQESNAIVRIIAEDLNMKRINLLTDNFRYIFCYLFCNCSRKDSAAGFQYVFAKTKFEMSSLLRLDCQRIYNELLLQMGTKQQQVLRGLAMLAQADDRLGSSSTLTDVPDNLREYLQSRFLGFLVFFDSLILNANVLLNDKQEYLKSLIAIMPIMGTKHITEVRMKLMTTLRLILKFNDSKFLQFCAMAWDTFVRTLSDSAIGPILSQIVVALLPLLRSHPAAVERILHHLAVEKRDSLQEHFHELYFIPDNPELEHINAVIKEFQERPSSQDEPQSFIKRSLGGICHENREVRIYALRNLKGLLREHQATLHAVVLGRDSVDPILPQLVAALLAGCRDQDSQVRNLVGWCLGELGAIDPGRLETTNCLARDQVKLYRSIEDTSFAIDLIAELTRSFLGARDTSTQDCSSYSIQEILLLYECRDATDDASQPGGLIWSGLPEDTKENIAPLLKSRYIATASEKMWDPQKSPIFYNLKRNTYHSWVTTWCVYLTSKVRQNKAKDVFTACIKTIRYDASVALFLLPHILVYVLQDGIEEDIHQIHQEILAVLDPCSDAGNITPIIPDVHHVSMQAVFTVLDYLTRWSRFAAVTTDTRGRVPATRPAVPDKRIENVSNFLDRIPKKVVADASFKAQAYTRALMNLEAHVKQSHVLLQENLSFFLKIYSDLDDPDGIAGVISLRKKASIRDLILSHESTGQTQDALIGYELAISLQPDRLSLHKGFLQCLMDLDQPHTALTYASGLISEKPEWIDNINQYRVEAAWKLSSWEQLGQFLNSSGRVGPNWGLDMGRIFEAVQCKNMTSFSAQLKSTRIDQMAPLSAASMENGSYQRGYNYIVRLHMLDELEKGISLFQNLKKNGPSQFEKMLTEWGNRKQVVQASMRHLEPILNLRRVLLGIAEKVLPSMNTKIQQEIGRCWLHSAQVSRKCGHLQRAHSSLLAASQFNLPEVYLEQAKWHWQKGEHDKSILSLQKVIKEYHSGGDTTETVESTLQRAKTKLLLARYTDESGNLESSAIMNMFREVVDINTTWEDGHFYLAQYLDRILCTFSADRYCDTVCRVIKHFGQSLMHGCRFVYQSMPRMLSLWLDYVIKVADNMTAKRFAADTTKDTMNRQLSVMHEQIIIPLAKQLPPYLFLTAFSQLISRICHSHPDVFCALKEIIVRVLTAYPQQAVWMMMAVSKSSTHEMRTKRCKEIFEMAVTRSAGLKKFISDATKLADKLVELCNKTPDSNNMTMKVSVHFKDLARQLEDPNFSRIILPRQISMLVTLPTSQGSYARHDPFPQGQVYFNGIEDKIEVMPSLQKPKKITLRGSDGKLYAMMCKPKDDLRKDCRLMEFNSVVNKFLLRDVESRRRQLHIRTYTVIPLNDECGLLEWVPNLSGLRYILNNIYNEKKLGMTGKELRTHAAQRSATCEQKQNVFKNILLPKHPPVFSEWFLRTFPDPTTWYFARLSYCRTIAVMSMVGYILGLGDRHGENILLDSSCGDAVHVDFNCLFNKGETFDWPELVPFRLTHNMIEAMGPLGYEGVYRKTCETALRVMRKEIDTLMSLLKPFIYDPLVEWSSRPTKVGPRAGGTESGEISNEKAKALILDIEQRLKGIIKSKIIRGQGLPLSIEGQVNHLIQEATSDKNLCQMFIGWAAYM